MLIIIFFLNFYDFFQLLSFLICSCGNHYSFLLCYMCRHLPDGLEAKCISEIDLVMKKDYITRLNKMDTLKVCFIRNKSTETPIYAVQNVLLPMGRLKRIKILKGITGLPG